MQLGIPTERTVRLSYMSTLAERIRECLDEKEGASEAALAAYVGVKAPSVYDWLNGDTKRLAGMNLMKAAEYFGVSPVWLDSGRLPKRPSGAIAAEPAAPYDTKYVMIPKLDIKVSGGDGYLTEYEEIDGKYPLPRSIIIRKKLVVANLRVATVIGRSMEKYLYDMDEVVVDIKDHKIVNNQVYTLHTEDGERVKRLFKQLDGKIRVISDNDNKLVYPDEFLTPDTPFNISGKIVHRSGG